MIRLRPEQAKNKHGRSVPITGALVDIIKRRREARKIASKGTTQLCKLVFHREGRAIIEFRKRRASACKKAGCAGSIFHDLRRSAVSAMIQARVPRLVAMQISAHRTASMFHRYGIAVKINSGRHGGNGCVSRRATTEASAAIERRADVQAASLVLIRCARAHPTLLYARSRHALAVLASGNSAM